jgi:hypothetical protein
MKALGKSIFVGTLATIAIVGCQRKDGGGDSASQSNTRLFPLVSGDGCLNVPRQMKDGYTFDRFADGRIKQGLIVKVIRSGTDAFPGGSAGYIQSSEAARDPDQVGLHDLGRYTGRQYAGGTYEASYIDSHTPMLFDADGNHFWGSNVFRYDEPDSPSLLSMYVRDSKFKVLGRVAVGRFLQDVQGAKHYLFYPVNGACFGAAANRGRQEGVNNGVQHSGEGGSFAIYLGAQGRDLRQNNSQPVQDNSQQQQQQGQTQSQQQGGGNTQAPAPEFNGKAPAAK